MATGRRIEGPRAPLFYAAAGLALVTLLSSFSVSSQSVDMSTLEQCIALETEALKLRCFEAIIASSETDVVAESTAPTSVATATSPPDEVIAAPHSTTDNMVVSEPVANASATPVAEGAAAIAPAATEAPQASDDLVGQEHLERPEPEQALDDTLLHATVVEVSKGRYDILYFTLDNGQVWRQIEARRFYYPKNTEFEVNINRGMMGEYRMRIGDNSPMVRIRRVK